MTVNFELTNDDGRVVMCQLSNALVEEIEDALSIHADKGFMMSFPMDCIENKDITGDKDTYEFYDGSRLVLEFV